MGQEGNFNYNTERVDELFLPLLSENSYAKLFDVFKLLLVLSHGQASVERGFSINKEVEVENLKEHSLIAQRLICDHVTIMGGVLNVNISKPMLVSAVMAIQKYE